MPSVGTPSSKSPGSTCGASSAYTEAGPPERTSACGRRARTAAGETVCGTSSEYTRASRTRRAISCEYWPPRSTTRTGRSSGEGSGRATTSAPVIRRLLRDRDVVRMALAQASARDADEARVLELLDRGRAAVAHRLPEAADELVEDAAQRPLVGHLPLDSLGDELLHVLDVALEVAVLREAARLHRAERAHAAVCLEALPLLEDHLAWALLDPGERRAEHDGVRARGERLRDVAGELHAAVGDQRHAPRARDPRAVVDGGDLRYA